MVDVLWFAERPGYGNVYYNDTFIDNAKCVNNLPVKLTTTAAGATEAGTNTGRLVTSESNPDPRNRPYIIPSNPPAAINTYQSGLCLHPESNYQENVCKGFFDGTAAGQYDFQNGNSYSGTKFMDDRFGAAYGVGYWDGYNMFYPQNGTQTQIQDASYSGGNVTTGNMMPQSEPQPPQITTTERQPSTVTQSPVRGGIDWMQVCTTLQSALVPSCDTLVNPDNTLTSEGRRAVECVTNGALLALGATALKVPTPAIAGGLDFLAASTGCGGIVNMNALKNVADPSTILQMLGRQRR
jgi:hypothetical protein